MTPELHFVVNHAFFGGVMLGMTYTVIACNFPFDSS